MLERVFVVFSSIVISEFPVHHRTMFTAVELVHEHLNHLPALLGFEMTTFLEDMIDREFLQIDFAPGDFLDQ